MVDLHNLFSNKKRFVPVLFLGLFFLTDILSGCKVTAEDKGSANDGIKTEGVGKEKFKVRLSPPWDRVDIPGSAQNVELELGDIDFLLEKDRSLDYRKDRFLVRSIDVLSVG